MNIKKKLKEYKLFYNLNAFLKSRQMKHKMKALDCKYNPLTANITYNEEEIGQKLRLKLQLRGIRPESLDRRIRIFWIGANFAQDDSGFLQALNRVGEVFYFHNHKGDYGQEFSSERMNPAIVDRNSKCLLEQVQNIEKTSGKIDLVIGQMWANYISVNALKQLQGKGIITVNISMDDRLPELWEEYNGVMMGSVGLVDGIDLTLTTTPECSGRFIYHGGLSIFWPLASDQRQFKPAPNKDIDVSFVGNKYGIRGAIVQKIMDAGLKIEAFGGGWPNGPVDAKGAIDIFNRSKIILGVGTIGYCTDVYTMKLRDFDATMAGALYITHRNPDLLKLFKEAEEIECYADADEAVRKISFYLEHPQKIETIGLAALSKARKYHTWDKRIRDMISFIGFSAPHIEDV